MRGDYPLKEEPRRELLWVSGVGGQMRTLQERSLSSLLSSWAAVGVLVLLCAPWLLSSNKIYHQLLALMLWLPALLALGERDFRHSLCAPEMLIFAILVFWTLVSLGFTEGGVPLSEAKQPFYVLLSLLGVMLAARYERCSLELLLLLSIIVGGLFSLVSLVRFAQMVDTPPGYRLVAIGLWDAAIMAAHAVGALAVLGACLLRGNFPATMRGWLVVIMAGAGGATFLLVNQTRGVWMALFATLLVVALMRPGRWERTCVLLVMLGAAGVALLWPELLIQRGLSYRPTLFAAGLKLLAGSPWAGVGPMDYALLVPETGLSYKHAHNLYLNVAIRLGVPGLCLFLLLWGSVARRAWLNRGNALGCALLALWCFSTTALLTDGIGLWLKPNADWLVIWLPVALSLVLADRHRRPA